jgi:hypothetical protein
MGMISAAYFDASGKQEGYPFVTVAGAASPIKKWGRFEKQWFQALKKEGVSEFHATDFASNQGEYKGWKGDRQRRSEFVRCLMKIIKENSNKLFMVTVEMSAWKEAKPRIPFGRDFIFAICTCGFYCNQPSNEMGHAEKVRFHIQSVF